MDTEISKQIQERLEELPEEIRAAVHSAELGEKVQKLGTKHALHIDQVGKLEDETLLVMLGFSDPADFENNLAVQLSIPAQAARALAEDIGHEIFTPIRRSMQEFSLDHALEETLTAQAKNYPHPHDTPPKNAEAAAVQQLAPAPKAPDMHPADMMLSQKTVSAAPPAPPVVPAPPTSPEASKGAAKIDPAKPKSYNNDPYREPPL